MAKSPAPSASPVIATNEFVERRQSVLKSLDGSVGVVFAGEGHEPRHGLWASDPHFFYLTGIGEEAGAAVLFDPSHEDPARRIVLFLRPLNPELERWDGYREYLGGVLRDRFGFTTIMRTTALPDMLSAAARRAKKLSCLHSFANYNGPVSPDLTIFRKIAERIPGVAIEDRSLMLRTMRSVKSVGELTLMRRAIDITAAGFAQALKAIRPNAGERAVCLAIEDAYRAGGASGPSGGPTAYNSIVGSGLNGTVLHYRANDGPTNSGELLVIDSGAQYLGYAADITRTYPVSGKFDSTQADFYNLVLTAQAASIKAAKPKATLTDVNNATRAVFDKAGVLDGYWHGIGHHLGLQVHDADPGTALAAGHVITIEPGLYLPDVKMGCRIEDDILITAKGNENLSAMIPKSIKEIEAGMR